MFDWAKIILLGLQLLNKWMDWAQAQGYIKQGRDEAIAEQARELFRKTSHAKKVMENVNAMSNEEVDAALVALEPSDSPASTVAGGPETVQRRGTPGDRG